MATATNIHGFNIGGNNNSFDQRGHFYRAFLDGNVSGMLVKQNSTPNMTVLVEHGSALLNKNTISASIAEIKSDTSVTIDTANTSNPRIDSIVIYEDTSVVIPTVEANYWQDGAGGRFKIVSLPGTAAAVPTALTDANIQSAIGAGKPWARLANITVPTNSTTILNSNINNSVRNKLGVALGSMNSGNTAGVLTANASGVVAVGTNTVDANGWTVYDYGGWKEYAITKYWSAGSPAVAAVVSTTVPYPVGLSSSSIHSSTSASHVITITTTGASSAELYNSLSSTRALAGSIELFVKNIHTAAQAFGSVTSHVRIIAK